MLGQTERHDDAHDGPQPESRRATLFVNNHLKTSAYLLKIGVQIL